MKRVSRIIVFCLAAVLIALLIPMVGAAGAAEQPQAKEVTVLFTHDLHSHFLPIEAGHGSESGGFARLKTALDRERAAHPDALTVDGGDFSGGSLIQTLYTTQAAELRTLGAMGYDAAAIGNHEYDHAGTGFAKMLEAAYLSGDKVPALVMANYKPVRENTDQLDIQRAMASYGVRSTLLLERGGIKYGIFGIMGEDAHDCAPNSGFELGDVVENAERCVKALKEQGAEVIICLSHSGTDESSKHSEDEQLAKKVEGIDVIVSGHSHTTLTEPIVVGDTYIVSSGPYCENLGSITFAWNVDGKGSKELKEYKLIPIDQTLPEDPTIAALTEKWKGQVSGAYLGRYNLSYDQALTTIGYDMNLQKPGVQSGLALGELVADSFQWAAANLSTEGAMENTVAVAVNGVLRAPLYTGTVTTSEAFDVLSIGMGPDGTSGYPLVSCYLTGKELKTVAEVDASVTPIMGVAQLYISGMTYTFNTHRMFFNRVIRTQLQQPIFMAEGQPQQVSQIKDDQLYRVIADLYTGQMLGTVQGKTFGLLSLAPKDENGEPITDFTTRVLRDQSGNEVKEWYALAAYLSSVGKGGMPDWYAGPDGRKQVSNSWNPIELVRNPNLISIAALLIMILAVLLVVFLVRRITGGRGRRRYGGTSRRRRFRR